MENWRENFSIISRLKVAGNRTDALAARLFYERLFTAANFHPPGISQRAVVCIKKLNAPPLKDEFQKFTGGNLALEWELKIRREVEKLSRRAFRPIREAVPAQAESVIFEDKAEMLACLAEDWRRGALAEHWWWRALFPNLLRTQTVLKIWLDSAEFAPFALQILSKTGGAEKFVKQLQPPEALDLLDEITGIFGLDKLRAAVFEPLAKKAPDAAELTVKPAGKSRSRTDENLVTAAKSDALFDLVIPEIKSADLSFEQQSLLETSLLLARSPRLARSGEFAGRVRISRLKNEFRKAVEGKKSVEIIEKIKAPEKSLVSREKTVRRLTDEAETKIKPPRSKPGSLVYAGQADEKAPEKTPRGLRKKPQTAEGSSIEPKKKRELSARAKIEFETARPEKTFEKIEQKERKGAKKNVEPARAEDIFEKYSGEFESGVEFGFETRFGGVFYLLNLGLYLGLYRDFTETLTTEIDLNIWDFVALLGLEFLGGQIKSDALWNFLKRAAERENDAEFGREFKRFQDWRTPPVWLDTFPRQQVWRWAKTKRRLVVRHADGFNVLDVLPRGAAEDQLRKELEIYQGNFLRIIKAEKKNLPSVKTKSWLENLAEYLRKRLFQALNLQTPEELNEMLFARQAAVSVSATHLEITFQLADLPVEVRLAGIDRNPGWIPAAGKFVYFHFV